MQLQAKCAQIHTYITNKIYCIANDRLNALNTQWYGKMELNVRKYRINALIQTVVLQN